MTPSSRDEGADEDSDVIVGRRVGRYLVTGEVGHGGMGRVWRAFDPELHREVALKEVRRGRLGTTAAQRLVAEARAMAKLSHPNVVAVYGVETIGADQVVLVMEYVEGRTLADWLDTRRPWPEVVAQFRQAGLGLAAAHAASLLHRDFKPENVLVGTDGRVRVTDFGLARELVTERVAAPSEQDTGEATLPMSAKPTARSGIVGTLPYLAPERLMGGPADPATDQFAFCVSLWEALFGERPFAGESVVALAMAMTHGPPTPPGDAQKIPAWLLEALRRGLAPNPERRWPSMEALLHVLTSDPSKQRRRWMLAAAGVGAIGLGVVGIQAWAGKRAPRCSEDDAAAHLQASWGNERRAEVRDAITRVDVAIADGVWAQTEQRLDDYARAWTDMHVDACMATTVRGEQSPKVMDLRMACLQRANAELGALTEVLAAADAQTVHEAHRVVAGLPPLDRCADVNALQAEVEPPLPAEAHMVEALRTDLARASAARRAGRYDDARAALDAATTKLASVTYGPVQAEVAIERGALLDRLGEYEAAAKSLREGMQLASRWRQDDAMASAVTQLVVVLGERLQRFEDGMALVPLARGMSSGDTLRDAALSAALVPILTARGDLDQAEHECRRAVQLRGERLVPDHVEVLEARLGCAEVMRARGKYASATAEYREVLELQTAALGSSHPAVAATRHDLALVLHDERRLEEAEAEFRAALELAMASLGEDHPVVASYRKDLSAVLQDVGKADEAEAEQRRALAVLERVLGADHPDTASSRFELALVLTAHGKLEQAEAENRRAITLMEAALGVENPTVARAHHNLAGILDMQERPDAAEVEYKRALELLEASLPNEHPDLALARSSVARILLERDAFAEARVFAEAAWDRRRHDDVPPVQRAHTAFLLAHVYWGDGDRARAIEMAETALTDYTRASADETADVQAWLAEHRR